MSTTDSTAQVQNDASEAKQFASQNKQKQSVSRTVQDTMRQQEEPGAWTRESADRRTDDVPVGSQHALYGNDALSTGSNKSQSAELATGNATQDDHDIESLLTGSQRFLNNLGNIDFSQFGSAAPQMEHDAISLGKSVMNFDSRFIQQVNGSDSPGETYGGGLGANGGESGGDGHCSGGRPGSGGASGAGSGGGGVAGGSGGDVSAGGSGGDVSAGGTVTGTGDGGAGGTVTGTGDGGAGGTVTGTGDGGAGGTVTGTGDGGTTVGAGGSTTGTGDGTTPVSGDGSGFTINNGKLTYNGSLLNGIAVTGEYAQQVGAQTLADQVSSQFPGINVVRLSTSPEGGAFTLGSPLDGGESVQDIDNVIQAFNAKGIGVVVDNHDFDANNSNNVAQTGNEDAWFAQLAQDNLGNNGVMFQTANEPIGSDQDIVQEQQNAYNAIRGTGSNAIVAFDLLGGGSAEPQLSDPSAYDADSNYVIDAHAYASNNPDPMSAVASEIAQTFGLTEANGGAVPVYIGETGNAIDGANIDGAATQLLNGVWSDGTGAIAWLYDGAATGFGSGNGADHLTNSDGSISSFGEEIAGLIANGAT